MIDFMSMPNLASIELGKPSPKPTSISGDQLEASTELWVSGDGKLKIGVWECTPGRFTAVRENCSEVCHIISGKVTLHGPDGRSQALGAGDMLVLPIGWRGEWTIHEQTRKLYILHMDGG